MVVLVCLMNISGVRADLESAVAFPCGAYVIVTVCHGLSNNSDQSETACTSWKPVPPCAIVEPDAKAFFVTVYENQYGADYSTNWKVLVLVPFATNETETETLDDTLETLIPSLWEYTEATKLTVDKPFIQDVNGARYLATNINISIDIEGGN